jgi:hypothetical protein
MAAGLKKLQPNRTPTSTQTLGSSVRFSHEERLGLSPSIVKMLLDFATYTHLNISFVVSQLTKFNHNPK